MNSKVWLITGASSGIGRAITEHVLSRGDIVVATMRKPSAIADLAATCGRDVLLPVELDVTNYAQAAAAFDRAKEAFGRIDVVVNNTGYGICGEFKAIPEEDARRLVDVNYWAPANITRQAIRFFREVNPAGAGGTVLQVTSGAGFVGVPIYSQYAASKHALEGLTEGIAGELDPAWNIKLCLVEPGQFDTNGPNVTLVLPVHPAYATSKSLPSHPMRADTVGVRFKGDAAKLARAVYDVVLSGDIPLRLPMGLDCVRLLKTKARALQETAESTEKWSVDMLREGVEGITEDDAIYQSVLAATH
ncbi:NAD(P)-binding protein [Coniophora puteana RWD-64-598 SS2]|uniref:NAD(P)-binding protein n=1 Tax=Coniophora puteana (strain RWD-64-598) TaxID=741705 RepID=A0A5M3MGX6_CONPW|nr:NAD(P)-binding protein [Coniophora puteana RWD-64-598 SS2]EIW78256.1 NAD(P)-binding protein [Coniophora puteana RWD-64-598 SS2]